MRKRIIGITGGVGTGKSTVLELLKNEWGAEVIQADAVAKELMEPGGRSFRAVVDTFGEGILSAEGSVDRKKLAGIIFADEEKRRQLNALTHPLVKEEVRRRMEASAAPLVIYEAALPEEAFMRELCDAIWAVTAPREVRIRRLMADRGYSREKCGEIMEAQLSDEAFRLLADEVIDNGGTLEETAERLRELLRTGSG